MASPPHLKGTRSLKKIVIYLATAIVAVEVILWLSVRDAAGHFNQTNKLRRATPFIEFKGAANVLDHNSQGYRIKESKNTKPSVKIAFFGGSTGYDGDPPISELLENQLMEKYRVPFVVANFSVVSSNHRQHLHNILETNTRFTPDFIIFYGGYNETAQTYFYDPRGGYPYNYYYRVETAPFVKLLYENSRIFQRIENYGVRKNIFSFTGLNDLRAEVGWGSEKWMTEIVDSYFDTLNLARRIGGKIYDQRALCDERFFAFYQPYQVPEKLTYMNALIQTRIKNSPYISDIHDIFQRSGDSSHFTDIVHVTQKGNQKISEAIFKGLESRKVFKECVERVTSGWHPVRD
jgi:hypothetical protein